MSGELLLRCKSCQEEYGIADVDFISNDMEIEVTCKYCNEEDNE